MELLYAITGLTALMGIIFVLFSNYVKQKQLKRILAGLSSVGILEKSASKAYDYTLKSDNQTYLIKLIYAPGAVEVSFNSKNHWQIFNSGNKKMYETNGFSHIEGKKVVLIYPEPGKIVKYINENEVVFVKKDMDVFGVNVIRESQIEAFFKG